jgi:hypothetical protein
VTAYEASCTGNKALHPLEPRNPLVELTRIVAGAERNPAGREENGVERLDILIKLLRVNLLPWFRRYRVAAAGEP